MSTGLNILDIGSILDPYAGRDIVYCPNPGNAGDALIAVATTQLFQARDIRASWVSWNTVVEPGRIVLYGGGGNLSGKYRQAATFLEANHRQAERLILLPHTVTDRAELLGSLGGNVDLIAREPVSYRHCKSMAEGANVFLSHDLALSLDVRRLREKAARGPFVNAVHLDSRRRKKVFRTLINHWFAGKRHLSALRADKERAGTDPLPDRNHDVSDIFAYGVTDEESTVLAARHFIDFIAAYDEIVTDRLHVCIGAALLGKKVTFGANSYYKNEEVFHHSLREKFPLIDWVS